MTNQIKIAAAQFNPVKANVRLNIKKHLEIIEAAVEEKVDLIIFPELRYANPAENPFWHDLRRWHYRHA